MFYELSKTSSIYLSLQNNHCFCIIILLHLVCCFCHLLLHLFFFYVNQSQYQGHNVEKEMILVVCKIDIEVNFVSEVDLIGFFVMIYLNQMTLLPIISIAQNLILLYKDFYYSISLSTSLFIPPHNEHLQTVS